MVVAVVVVVVVAVVVVVGRGNGSLLFRVLSPTDGSSTSFLIDDVDTYRNAPELDN